MAAQSRSCGGLTRKWPGRGHWCIGLPDYPHDWFDVCDEIGTHAIPLNEPNAYFFLGDPLLDHFTELPNWLGVRDVRMATK